MGRHRSHLLVPSFNDPFGHRFPFSTNLGMFCLFTVRPEQSHKVPLQIGPHEHDIQQHQRHIEEHEIWKVYSWSVGKTIFVESLEGKIGAGSNDRATSWKMFSYKVK